MHPAHNEDEVEEVLHLDENTGSNHHTEVSIVNCTVDISDEEIMSILNIAIKRHSDDLKENA